jgi:hypothetical protein
MFKLISSAALLIFLTHCVTANAAAIGIGVNFTGTSTQTGISMAATDTAGVVSISHYNNFTTASGTLNTITDNSGAVITGSTLSVTAVSGTAYAGDTNTVPTGGDGELMKGYLTSGGTPGVSVTDSVAITLPASLFSPGGDFANGFDLIVYSQNNSPNDYMVSSFTVNGTTRYVENAPITSGLTFNGTYTPSTLTAYPTNNSQIANYISFNNLTSSALTANVLTITFATLADASGSANTYQRGAFNGFELIAVPEPASLAIFGAAIFIGSLRRR